MLLSQVVLLLLLFEVHGDYGGGEKCSTHYETVYATVYDTVYEKKCSKGSNKKCKIIHSTSYEGGVETQATPDTSQNVRRYTKQATRNSAQQSKTKNVTLLTSPHTRTSMGRNLKPHRKSLVTMLAMVTIRKQNAAVNQFIFILMYRRKFTRPNQ